MTSIRSRLLLWLLSGLVAFGSLAGFATYFQAREELNEMLDHELQQIAYSIELGHYAPSVPSFESDDNEDKDFVAQTWDFKGKLLYTSNPVYPIPLSSHAGLATIVWRQQSWRIFLLRTEHLVVQIAQPIDARDEAAAGIAAHIMIPVIALVPFLVLFAWVSVDRGLRPLRQITTDLRNRGPESLAVLAPPAMPDEIRPMVKALNDLLRRLSDAIATQRQFVGDAAHELRTPLTALSLQAQIVEKATRPEDRAEAIGDLKRGIDRATHLVRQLLTLARMEPDARRLQFDRMRLDVLAQETVAEHASAARAKHIDLVLHRGESTWIRGDAEDVRILLRNLIDNAIRYSSENGHIDVRVYNNSGHVLLSVEDTGPGVPNEERARIFDRFYRRADCSMPGAGLGLAIVKRVADLHGAQITLSDGDRGKGLHVRIAFLPS